MTEKSKYIRYYADGYFLSNRTVAPDGPTRYFLDSSLFTALSKFDFYPEKSLQMIRIAEEVSKLEHFFEQLSVQYTEEVEYETNAISGLLEPLIIIFLGLVVG